MLFQGSRYLNTLLYENRETPILGIRRRYKFDLTNAVYYTVIQGDTLDGLAFKYYQNSQLYWAILDANPQYQSELEIKAGDIICIPPYEEVVRVSE